jgi:hypothetical protein
VNSIKAPPVAACRTSVMKDSGAKQRIPSARQRMRIPRAPRSRDLKTTVQKFAKERILKIDCIVNIILSNELRDKAPPETMF